MDSITELGPLDAGCVAISGSHGGRSSAAYALAVRPWVSVFNDAGVGLDQAGIAALDLMQSAGLAACTVSHLSAHIGQASSAWETGRISHANAQALTLGLQPGLPLRAWADALALGSPSEPGADAS